jgi:hypothetical protein
VLLAARERRARVDFGGKVTGQLLLDELGGDDVLRLGVRELDPITDDVVGDPEDGGIDALTALLLLKVRRRLLLTGENTLSDPVVSLVAKNLAEKLELRCARDDGETLQRLLDKEASVLAEANTGPLEHLRRLKIVRDDARLFLGNEMLVLGLDEVRLLCHKAANFVENLVHFDDFGRALLCVSINVEVLLGVSNLEVGLLDESRDFFELVITVFRMVQHDSVEDLDQVRVKVLLDRLAKLLGLTQLSLESVEGFCANAHI